MRISLLFLLGLATGIYTPVFGQKYSNEFLSIGVGARAQGLGNAVVAGVSDVYAGVWNPAGLVATESTGLEVGAMHSEWFAGVGKYDYLGVSLPLAKANRRLGVSLIRFGVDEIPNTLSLYESDGTINFDNLREFSAADYAMFFSYAQQLGQYEEGKGRWLIGGNLKVVHRRIGPFANSWGFGVDLGLQYRKGNWRLGLVGKDLTTTFNAWAFNFTEQEKEVLAITNNEIPINSVEITRPQVLGGLAYRIAGKKISFQPEINFILSTDGRRNTLLSSDPFSLDPSAGLEIDYRQVVFLRAGVNQFQRETAFDGKDVLSPRPSIGVGLRLSAFQVDYAFTDLGANESTYSHVISLLLKFRPRS
ncbi:MAG: hypothetical protein H6555_13300 [Lewinellaceae bacterium]|nr:hypothetical protein [Lewinellaceae bacterium]